MSGKGERFYTGLVTARDEERHEGPWHGAGWTALLAHCRERREWSAHRREIVIEAQKEETAQKGLDLILTLHGLSTADPEPLHLGMRVVRPGQEDSDDDWQAAAARQQFSTAGFPLSCAMAARASRKRDWVYAASLYRLSQRMHANHHMDLDPRMYPHEHRSPLPYDHVRFGYAIVVANAVIEQLGLDVRASREKPWTLGGGKWNPPVLENLQERLRRAHVDPERTILWMLRGGKTKIEKTRPPRSRGKQSWSYREIRDSEVTVVDAINDLNWLRSKIAAHRVREWIRLLSAYDVANAQNLCRLLILGSLGFAE